MDEVRTGASVFLGVFGISFLCRAKANLHRGRRLGIWGIDCAHIKAMVPPNLLRKTFYISEKTQKRPEYCLIQWPWSCYLLEL